MLSRSLKLKPTAARSCADLGIRKVIWIKRKAQRNQELEAQERRARGNHHGYGGAGALSTMTGLQWSPSQRKKDICTAERIKQISLHLALRHALANAILTLGNQQLQR
ncbi:hypothetical protein AGOR_G00062900 [Albula goreensis]|uniref:Uncharacterized protein n=1 Tax=Albula goreensis TaxID=1534307 RepID=A0A8T3DUA5_9TELE|nr:hypothetical protein AGOR_G00062900 [Albula goreensis]